MILCYIHPTCSTSSQIFFKVIVSVTHHIKLESPSLHKKRTPRRTNMMTMTIPIGLKIALCFVYATVTSVVWVCLLVSRCQYVEDAANITSIRRLDVFDPGEQRCQYEVEWAQQYTSWWSFRAETERRNATDVLTLPCISFEAHCIEGCYDNSFRHPRFRVSPEMVVGVIWFRLGACLLLAPVVAVLTKASEQALRRLWMRYRERAIIPQRWRENYSLVLAEVTEWCVNRSIQPCATTMMNELPSSVWLEA